MDERRLGLRDVLAVLWRRRGVVATFFIVLVAVVAVGTFNQVPIYRSATTLVILPDTPKILNFQEVENLGASNYFLYQDYFNTQTKILRSAAIAHRVIDRLGLKKKSARGSVPLTPEGFVENLDIEPVKESQLVKVGYRDPDPVQAARIANTVAQVYLESALNDRILIAKQAVDFLSQRLTQLKEQVVRSESEVLKFKSDNSIVGWDEKHNLILQKLVDLNAAFSKTHTERIELEARAKQMERVARRADAEAVESVIASALVNDLKARRVELQRARAELAVRYRDAHPVMRRLNSQSRLIQEAIDAEVGRIVRAARHTYEIKQAEEDSLGRELEKAKSEAVALNQKMISHTALQQEALKNQELYDVLLGRLKETDITSNLRANNLRVVDPAEPSRLPVKPQVALNLALALLIGLVGGMGLAFVFEAFDDTLTSQEEAEQILQLPVLGVLPAIQDAGEAVARDLYVHHHPKSTMAESCRAVRTSLQFLDAVSPHPTLVVTSATPLEGKSSTCCHLGIALAQAGERVVLIDTDLRRSRLHQTFGLSNARGFSNLLSGSGEAGDFALPTEVANLYLIPSGPLPPNPSELLGSARMAQLIAALAARFDRVIFDSPPLLAVTDALVISRQVSGALFVVKVGKVSKSQIREASRRLGDRTGILGAVVNGVDVSAGAYTYQYGYGDNEVTG